ncbi:DUF3025 domain-containing protein [Aliiglaciecola sp. SL4]|uniref:DUF3025 domain-containing protein n=1 Tax=Aliiglaciecola sp. SL4 TaxID=3239806 RepID=UPI00355C70BE
MTSVNQPSPRECHELWTGIVKRPPFTELEQRYSLTKFDNLLHADTLNVLKSELPTIEGSLRGQASHDVSWVPLKISQRGQASHDVSGVPLKTSQRGQASKDGFEFTFKCQDSMPETGDYYETIIFKDRVIPTRPNSWHDLFNGLVWLNFPKTKTLLNRWHVEDIQSYGLTPRTHRRNQITLFDECGIVLAVSDSRVCEHLANHQWQKVFIEDRHKWDNQDAMFNDEINAVFNMDCHVNSHEHKPQIKAFVFGHANYEMLLNPFIGLTGKWLPIKVDDRFFAENHTRQLSTLDSSLYDLLCCKNSLSDSGKLSPIPLLGIPGWYSQNQSREFYLNQDYFRPARS